MDGPGIATQESQKLAAYEREMRASGSRIGVASSSNELRPRETTLTGLVQSADELCGLLAELGSRLEKVEHAIAGLPGAGEPAPASERRPEGSVTDAIDGRLSRARMMVAHLHEKMSRIERRIG